MLKMTGFIIASMAFFICGILLHGQENGLWILLSTGDCYIGGVMLGLGIGIGK